MTQQSEEKIFEVILFAEKCQYEREHSHQVAKLSLRLFDELESLHGLGKTERELLNYAAILHDIGWLYGRKEHHKQSREMIMASEELTFSKLERTVVALVARYHRKSLPDHDHKYYADLSEDKKDIVRKLSALIRVADGLDRRHISSVDQLTCSIEPRKVTVHLKVKSVSDMEKEAALNKADLFKIIFGKELELEYVV